MNVQELFRSLDAPFINFREKVEPIVWNGSDVYVKQFFDVKIPASAGCIIKYSFTSVGGDIELSTEFLSPGRETEVLVQPERVPSDTETITGSFKSARDGTFRLVFDNAFSWFNAKTLTYKISLFQPAFTVADTNRCLKSRRLLTAAVEHTKQAEAKMAEQQERKLAINSEISELEARLNKISLEVDQKRQAVMAAEVETKEMAVLILHNLEKRNGLCIRSLDYRLLAEVLSYLGRASGAYTACKYWKVALDHRSPKPLPLPLLQAPKATKQQPEPDQKATEGTAAPPL